jgi:hypothetical protein
MALLRLQSAAHTKPSIESLKNTLPNSSYSSQFVVAVSNSAAGEEMKQGLDEKPCRATIFLLKLCTLSTQHVRRAESLVQCYRQNKLTRVQSPVDQRLNPKQIQGELRVGISSGRCRKRRIDFVASPI